VNTDFYVVMGVAGSGKSVIGAEFAKTLGLAFVEGDDFHSPRNIERMSSGIALSDDDRADWLRALALHIRDATKTGRGLVVTCSALRRAYRDILRAEAPGLQFIFLTGSRTLIADRLANRGGHFMPPSLLDSQLATLEEPALDEDVWVCDITKPPPEIVSSLVARATA
jgi:gluconokinase